ncbi:MAG: hypothetical protein MUF71_11060 [Candidatus Kapabacteria bacterium]|jgi:hypothetical protein|nr:hypothetical protein [Candidatus Kapabacteria bacterium]
MKSLFKSLILCALPAIALLVACERQFPTTPGVISATDYYPIIQTANAWTVPAAPANGAVITLELIFNSYSPIRTINLLQVTNRTTSGVVTRDTVVSTAFMYQVAYSTLKGGDTLLMSYTVRPVPRPAGTTVSQQLIGEIINQNGLLKRRATGTFTPPAM